MEAMINMPYFRTYSSSYSNRVSFHILSVSSAGIYFKLLIFASQTGGYVVIDKNKNKLDIDAIGRLVGCQREECERGIEELLRHGFLEVENDIYIIPHLIEEAKNYTEFISAKKRASKAGNEARWGDKSKKKTKKQSQWDAIGMPEGIPNASQTCPQSQSQSQSHNIELLLPRVRAREAKKQGEELPDCHIEPPSGMPKSLEEAITMAEMAGVPASFTADFAYPKLLACGYRDGNNPIRNFGQWAKVYHSNWTNLERHRNAEKAQRAKPQAIKSRGHLFDDTPTKEFKF
jgi:hypothetical protein